MIVQLLATTLWMMKSRTMLGIILISVLIAVLVTAAKNKIIFGKEFNGVCGCTFRVDNPQRSDLPFLKEMVKLCKLYISNHDIIKHG